MIFGGMQKLTLLDYPGKVACTLFTKGCNFYCPFCHNAFLVDVDGREESISSEYVIDYLKKRKGILDGVCITGGEPLIHTELADFIKEVKDLGYSVKLDTNGSFPKKLKALAEAGLIDYVAMDVKNCLSKYHTTSGCDTLKLSDIEESMDFLMEGRVDYEFRTTVAKELHTPQDIDVLTQRIAGANKYFLQNFVDSGNILKENLHPVDEETLKIMESTAKKNIKTACIRGNS